MNPDDHYESDESVDMATETHEDAPAQESAPESSQAQQHLEDLTRLMMAPENRSMSIEQFQQFVRSGERPSTPEEAGPSREEILDLFEEGANRDAIQRLLDYADGRVNSLNKTVESRLAPVARMQQESIFDRGVRATGIDPADPGFVSFQSGLRSDNRFKALARVDANEAGKYAAEMYNKKYGSRAQDARDASLMDRGSRGGAGRGGPKVELPRNASLATIFENKKAGRQIVWKD